MARAVYEQESNETSMWCSPGMKYSWCEAKPAMISIAAAIIREFLLPETTVEDKLVFDRSMLWCSPVFKNLFWRTTQVLRYTVLQ